MALSTLGKHASPSINSRKGGKEAGKTMWKEKKGAAKHIT